MKRLWLCLALLLCLPGFAYAQGVNPGVGESVGVPIEEAALNLTKGSKSKAISGNVLDKNKKPIQEVLMTLSGSGSAAKKTNKKGKYVFLSLGSGDYTITPSLGGYLFTPESRNVTIATRNLKKIDFEGHTTGVGAHHASGMYKWNSTTGVLTWTWKRSNFVCDGPELGKETITGVTITSTTMAWPDGEPTTWTRPTGTAGKIVGTWTASDSETGNSWTLTFKTSGTVSVVGNIVSCSSGINGVKAEAQHWPDDYYVSLRYSDKNKTATSVSVTGTGIIGSVALTYHTGMGSWGSGTPESIISFGTTYPTGLPFTYTFTITDTTGIWTADSIVSCFQEQFVTNISPTGTVLGTPTFSWTGISDFSPRYGVQVNDCNGNWLWANYYISGTSIVYNGPALTSGSTYEYAVSVESSSACINPSSGGGSYVGGSFTYQ